MVGATYMAFYLTVLGINGLNRTTEALKKDALKTLHDKGIHANMQDINLHRVVIYNAGGEVEVKEAYEGESLHKKKFSSNEELQTYLKEIQMEISKPIIDVNGWDINYWEISPWKITEEAPSPMSVLDIEDDFDFETKDYEDIKPDYSDLDPELAEMFTAIDNIEVE